jgi:hypothetical protein
MKIKTDNLTGPALDWAVAKCEMPIGGYKRWVQADLDKGILHGMNYSTDWSWGGPIIEREEIGIRRNAPCSTGREWEASGSITAKGAGYRWGYGPTPLIAAMRCYVASRLGDEVDIPEELK